MKLYYDVLELFNYDLHKTAIVISCHCDEAKESILKKLEKYDVKEYEFIFNVILENKDDSLYKAEEKAKFKSEIDYIKYLKDLLILNDILFIEWTKEKIVRQPKEKTLF